MRRFRSGIGWIEFVTPPRVTSLREWNPAVNPRVVFRVDAGLAIGSGHVMRSLALAEALRSEGASVAWITRAQAGDLRRPLAARGFEVHALPPADPAKRAKEDAGEYERWLGVSWEIDAEESLAALERNEVRADLLVVDHYGIDARWEGVLRRHVTRLAVIDDLGNRPHECDVLIAPAAGGSAARFRRLVPAACRIVSGASHALVASEFARQRLDSILRRQERAGVVTRVLVGFGGVDRNDLTSVAVRALRRCRFEGELDVVLGDGAPHKEAVAALLHESFPAARLHIAPASMARLMAGADLAVGAAGVTSWERCAMGLPAVVVCAAENQKAVARALAARGAAVVTRLSKSLEAVLAERIGGLLRDPARVERMGRRAATVCDGLGAARTALFLLPERARDGKPVTLRLARASDCGRLYRWQIDPSTRKFARRPDPPRYEEHRRWLHEKLKDPRCIFHIIEYDGVPAGVVRLDALDHPRQFEVSIYIGPGMKQRGIARAALRGIRRLLPWAEFHAWVMPENAASRRLFEGAGYVVRDGRYVQNGRYMQDEPRVEDGCHIEDGHATS